jgi:phosphoribosylglycinamide formyltransferase 1
LKSLAIFASGGGSNALKIIEHFDYHSSIKVACVFTNNPQAGVIEIADFYDIPCEVITKKQLQDHLFMNHHLEHYNIDYLILAGFLQLIPPYLIAAYPDRIINIHPALLPKYGGKGMYGMNVHKAVVAAKEKTSGPTIHLVNEEYDKGRILAQYEYNLTGNETPEQLASEVLKLEHLHFGPTIEQYIQSIE